MVRQPANLMRRQARKTTSNGMPWDRTRVAAASSSPAKPQAHTGGSGHHIIAATAIMTRNANSVSLTKKCSIWMA